MRRLATRAELGDEYWTLAQKLADDRLVVTNRASDGKETVEVVHEALIRGWRRLREWMSTDRTFRTWQERLRVAVRQWEASDKDEDALLQGGPLEHAEDWMQERLTDLSEREQEYLQMSRALRDRRERSRRWRTRIATGAAIIFLILTGITWQFWRDAFSAARKTSMGSYIN